MYKKVALGGTFDHFHKGHEALINKAFEVGRRVIIGLVREPKQKEAVESLQTFTERKAGMVTWLSQKGCLSRSEVVPLSDSYGPTLTDLEIEAIVVSPLTEPGAIKINQKRQEQSLKKLAIEVVPCVLDQRNEIISSTRVRQGVIDRAGLVYAQLFEHDWTLNEHSREDLRENFGELLTEAEYIRRQLRTEKLITVGDGIIRMLIRNQLKPQYAIIDGKIERREVEIPADHYGLAEWYKASNLPGTIQTQAVREIQRLLTAGSGGLQIEGEEDLLVLPVGLLIPLNWRVVYGLPNKGIVVVSVDERVKMSFLTLLRKSFREQGGE